MIPLEFESMMDKKILMLSPHADDVAFSVGGIVANLSMRSDLFLITVFGRSGWALSQASGKKSSAVISAEREREDREYCARRRIDYELLTFPDSYLMGYDEDIELRISASFDSRTRDVLESIHKAVDDCRPRFLLAPCGLGGHVDHQIVRAAAASLNDVDVLYYEDVPYCSALPLSEIERQLLAQGLTPAITVDIGRVVESKQDDMWGYRSQTTEFTVSEMLQHAARITVGDSQYAERLWRSAHRFPC